MPPAKRKGTCRNSTLLDSLGQRLDLLTSTLSAADIAEKSIDIVKEIKELHAILRSLRDEASPDAPPRMVVVWGGPPSAASGRLPADLSGASPRTSSKPSGASGKAHAQKILPQYGSSN